ncbi:hypothetical protein GGX14DRAFT_607754 [Mycena pura]|uniref:Uncharacterized protein n=1 Tax=Mycena pura TaxID=153505 RepID=A0AAD6Y3C8_9AGAR|nr:hypothetical protein GGX14DRAFT_607754 [Mycena pura]
MTNDPIFSVEHVATLQSIVQQYVDGTAGRMDTIFELYDCGRLISAELGVAYLSNVLKPYMDQLGTTTSDAGDLNLAMEVDVNKPSFPETLWRDVLLDRFVTNRFATEPDEPQRLLFGDHQLEIKRPKVVSRVSNHGEWILAFWTYERAINFAFKYCRDELETYRNYIQDLFAG